MKQRITALLDLPQTYIMFYGNDADFFASLLIKYSSNNANAQTAIFNTEFNNTSIDYPVFFRQLFRLSSSTADKAELIDALSAVLSEEDIIAAEAYMSNSQNPGFPASKLVNSYFSQHSSVAIICRSILWLDYLSGLSIVKFRRARDQVAEYHDFIHDQFKNYPNIIYPYTADQVLDYMTQHDIERVAGFRLHVLFALPAPTIPVPTIDEVFESSLSDLYKQYRYMKPTTIRQQLRDFAPVNNKNKQVLCIEDVVLNPTTFARAFNITNENCFYEIQEWHRQNIELLTVSGLPTP